MTNLTDKWKKGELPIGWYYIKIADIVFIDFFEGKVWKNKKDEYINEVLAEVPTYEEWQAKLEENARLKAIKEKTYNYDYLSECYSKFTKENTKLKEQIHKFAESNQSLRKKLEEEKAKNRIDYYTGSPMDYLDECERARRKNKIFQNWIKNINKELLTSELRKTKEGNLFIVNLLKKIDQVLGEE